MFAGRGMDIPRMLDRLKRTADELGLPFTTRSMTFNSRRAQELGKWADQTGHGDAFHHAVFEAYFAKGLNIAQLDVLSGLAVQVGLDAGEVQRVLAQGLYIGAVDTDWQRCHEVGITAVPTFQMGGRFLVGAQPYEALRQLALSAGAGELYK